MNLKLIKNPDISKKIMYQTARIIYAETSASSLVAVEALASMIKNISSVSGKDISDIIADKNLFSVLDSSSVRHSLLYIPPTSRGFQMCLRVVGRMMKGTLPDMCCGATRFHHGDVLPYWAVARGYILDVDDLLFYS